MTICSSVNRDCRIAPPGPAGAPFFQVSVGPKNAEQVTASLAEVVGQLLGRLTWRDANGVALVLSKNVGFSDVLKAVEHEIGSLLGFVSSQQRPAENRFAARFRLPSDTNRLATIHIFVYNLFAPTASKRALKQPKT